MAAFQASTGGDCAETAFPPGPGTRQASLLQNLISVYSLASSTKVSCNYHILACISIKSTLLEINLEGVQRGPFQLPRSIEHSKCLLRAEQVLALGFQSPGESQGYGGDQSLGALGLLEEAIFHGGVWTRGVKRKVLAVTPPEG